MRAAVLAAERRPRLGRPHRVSQTHRHAFGMLFERHGPTIYNYCFRRVGNWATAEDLLSIVFLDAWRRLDKSPPSGKELPWLLGIATFEPYLPDGRTHCSLCG